MKIRILEWSADAKRREALQRGVCPECNYIHSTSTIGTERKGIFIEKVRKVRTHRCMKCRCKWEVYEDWK